MCITDTRLAFLSESTGNARSVCMYGYIYLKTRLPALIFNRSVNTYIYKILRVFRVLLMKQILKAETR